MAILLDLDLSGIVPQSAAERTKFRPGAAPAPGGGNGIPVTPVTGMPAGNDVE